MNPHTKPARLTQTFINSVEANGAKQRFSDHKVAGLCLRVAPGGTKTFVIRYRKPDNASAEMNIGRADVVTLEMARDRAKKHLAQVPDGHDPIEARRQAGIEARNKKMETLEALAEAFKASPGFLSKKIRTQEFYKSCLRVHILPRLGTRSVKEIGRKDIATFLDEIYSEHSGPASNSARRTLSVLFSYATELELIDFNPVSAVKQRHRGGQRTRQLNDKELKRLWQALDDLEGVTSDVSDMIRLCLFLPARVNEIAGMEWAELNLNDRLWTVRADRMKNNKPHELPFGECCRRLLEKRRNAGAGNNPWVFPAKSGIEPMNGKVASRACNRLSKDWGCTPFGPHALRRGFTTRMAEKGVRLEILERALSHDVTGGRAIAHYDHYSYRDEKRDLMEHWEETLLNIVQAHDCQSDQDESDE
ncbi:MAG: tyrosine-type recombinase/integrase [Hyphomonas sp.]|uniref:tyrosine-type recombinase/integrase n=1 Tax=Hyphomonas sp. TaxID=87 RepID=UPI0030027CE8